MFTRMLYPLLCIALLCGCGSASTPSVEQAPTAAPVAPVSIAPGSCGLQLNANTPPTEAIGATLAAEGQMVVQQNIDGLMALWDAEGKIVDAQNTPADDGDDQTWNGRDAIRNRYVRVVFPGAPAAVQPADLDIVIDGGAAVVTATTQIGSEISPGGDRWQLLEKDGCWLISSLTYNLEGQ
ncbi:MAG: hypothetical protein R3A44_33520 [Caldilineaceae bacterium]